MLIFCLDDTWVAVYIYERCYLFSVNIYNRYLRRSLMPYTFSPSEATFVLDMLDGEDFNDRQTYLGYSIPHCRLDNFLKAVDKAAQEAGGIPITVFNPEAELPSTSLATRIWLDDSPGLIAAAEKILSETTNCDSSVR